MSAEDPEHASEDGAGVVRRSATSSAGWEERLHTRPLVIGQFGTQQPLVGER